MPVCEAKPINCGTSRAESARRHLRVESLAICGSRLRNLSSSTTQCSKSWEPPGPPHPPRALGTSTSAQ
eukprot:6075824-Alexandrium_andersonii.AAC.1